MDEEIDANLALPAPEIPRWKQLLAQLAEIDAEPHPPGMSIDDFLYGNNGRSLT